MSDIPMDSRESVGRVTSLAVAVQPLIWAGMGRRYPWALLGLEGQAKIGWGVVAVALLVFGYPLASFLDATAPRRATMRRYAMTLLLVCPPLTAGFDMLSSRHFAQFGYGSARPLVALEGLVLVTLVFWIRSRRNPGVGIVWAAIGAFAHRLVAVRLFPLDERRSDMYAFLLRAVKTWRAGGIPHVKYLPGTWLAVAPSVFLGLDPRILGSVLLLGIGLALARAFRAGGQQASSRLPLAEPLAMLVLLNPYHAFRHDLYFDAFLALTAAIFCLVARGRGTTGSLLLIAALVGLAAATRQWAWVYGPFALLAAASSVAPPKRLLAPLALAGIVCMLAAVIVLLPIILDPAELRYAAFAFAGESVSEICLGVSALAASLGLVPVLPVMQAALCLVVFGRSFFAASLGQAPPCTIIAAGWFVWGGFILLNPFLENYFYLSLFLAAASLGVGAAGDWSACKAFSKSEAG